MKMCIERVVRHHDCTHSKYSHAADSTDTTHLNRQYLQTSLKSLSADSPYHSCHPAQHDTFNNAANTICFAGRVNLFYFKDG